VPEGATSLLASGIRSTDAGGEGPGLSPSPSPLRIDSRRSVGDWACPCGQLYRVLTEPNTFWPQSSRRGFLGAATRTCAACSADLEERFGLEAARLVSAALCR
jgi:hypothetical protein